MNFNEELAMAGELELTDSELETVSGGHWIPWWWYRRPEYEPYYYQPYWYGYLPYGYGYGGYPSFFGGRRDERRGGDEEGKKND